MRLQSHLPRLFAVSLAATVVVSAVIAAPAGAQRLRSPASSLVLAAPTVTCGASPRVNLSWTDSASTATANYRVMSNSSTKQNAWSAGAYLGNVRTTSVAAANGSFWQFAIDAITTVTRDSNVVSITINCAPTDGTAPSAPVINNIGAPSCSQVDLSWTASSDTGGSGLVGYNIWRDNTFVKRVNAPATTTSDTGLPASTVFSYQVSAVDGAGNQSARSPAITVTTPSCTTNQAPRANAGADQSVLTLVAVSFNGSGSTDDGTIASYQWNFGDGTTATGVATSHAYNSSGTYTVTLTVSDNLGATGQDTAVVTVANRPPTANAGPDQSATAGTSVSFNGSGSSDLDGTISSYAWSFGDATIGSGVTTSHAYASAGTYTVTLTVTDNKGATASDTATITVGSVANVPPVANAGANQSALTLVSLTFNGGGSSDPDGSIASYAWNFGDGVTGTGVSASHSYASSGIYTVTLTVTDNKGATASDTATATITNRPPTANAGPDVAGTAGSLVGLNGSGSDADGTISSYAWNFGDGATGSGASVSHTYAAAGTYTATLTVTDNKGATATDTATVTISSAGNQSPIPNAGADFAGTAGVAVTFNGTGSRDPDGTITSYNWIFGDGFSGSGSGATPSHTYASAGTYVATLNVIDNSGAGASDSVTVTINGASGPTIPTGVSATAASCSQVNLSWNAATASAGIQDYEVFRDGIPYYWATGTSYSDTARMQMTRYSYQVAARDRNGNISAASTLSYTMTPSCTGAGWYQWAKLSADTVLNDSMKPNAIAVDSSGNSIVVGSMTGTVNVGGVSLTSAGSSDLYIVKYSPTGQVLWAKRFGDSAAQYGTAVAVDGSGNVYVAGWYFGTVDFGGGPRTSNAYDMFLAKYSPTGAHQWSKVIGGSSTDEAFGVAVDSAGNVFVTGQFAATVDFGGGPLTSAGGFDGFLAKYDTNGAYVWAKRIGGTVADTPKGVGVDVNGNPVVAGYFSGTANFGGADLTSAGANDIFVAKYSAAGAHQWSERFGSANDERAYAVAVDGVGNIALTGYYFGSFSLGGAALPTTGSGAWLFVAKLNASGGHVWSKGIGSTGGYGSIGQSVAIDGTGNIVVTGSIVEPLNFGGGALTAPTATYDPFVAKYGPDGSYKWARRMSADWDDHGNGVAVDGSGNVFVAGDTTQGIDFGGGVMSNPGGAAGWIVKLSP